MLCGGGPFYKRAPPRHHPTKPLALLPSATGTPLTLGVLSREGFPWYIKEKVAAKMPGKALVITRFRGPEAMDSEHSSVSSLSYSVFLITQRAHKGDGMLRRPFCCGKAVRVCTTSAKLIGGRGQGQGAGGRTRRGDFERGGITGDCRMLARVGFCYVGACRKRAFVGRGRLSGEALARAPLSESFACGARMCRRLPWQLFVILRQSGSATNGASESSHAHGRA